MRVKDITIGETYNGVKVLEKFREKDHTKYWCICPICGEKFSMKAETVGKACRCKKCNAKSRIIDLTGKRFGRLVAIEYAGTKRTDTNRWSMWRCKCDCGKETVVRYIHLTTGNTRSCGCLEQENKERIVKVAQATNRKSASLEFYEGNLDKHPLRLLWKSMLTRCNNPNAIAYKHYGARGITVCERWQRENNGFENFVNDMGERPDGTTLDRIDVNGDYCPENCRWATDVEQANNKTDNVFIIVGDSQITAKQFCITLGLNYWTVIHQIRKGLDVNIIARNKGVDMRTKAFRRNPIYYNHNRVVSEEVAKLLENK